MATASRLSTSVLLTCAAIGVATGALSAGAGAISGPVSATVPIVYGLVLGVHVLPGVIAQELLRRPWVALITHLVAALVASAVVPLWIGRYIGTALLIGALQEGIAALGRYRRWEAWRFFLSAVIIGVLIAVPDLVRRGRVPLPGLGSDRVHRAVHRRPGRVDRRGPRDRSGAAPCRSRALQPALRWLGQAKLELTQLLSWEDP